MATNLPAFTCRGAGWKRRTRGAGSNASLASMDKPKDSATGAHPNLNRSSIGNHLARLSVELGSEAMCVKQEPTTSTLCFIATWFRRHCKRCIAMSPKGGCMPSLCCCRYHIDTGAANEHVPMNDEGYYLPFWQVIEHSWQNAGIGCWLPAAALFPASACSFAPIQPAADVHAAPGHPLHIRPAVHHHRHEPGEDHRCAANDVCCGGRRQLRGGNCACLRLPVGSSS